MKKSLFMIIVGLSTLTFGLCLSGCSETGNYTMRKQAMMDKSGAQLWGENCIRCHNAPPPNAYNDDQWDAIEMHMQIRANLTRHESTKIIEFIKSAN